MEMFSWVQRHHLSSNRYHTPATSSGATSPATTPTAETERFPPHVVNAASWVERTLRFVVIYTILLKLWRSRFFIFFSLAFYVYVLHSRGDLTAETVAHHHALLVSIWEKLIEQGRLLHLISLVLTDVSFTILRNGMERITDSTPSRGAPRTDDFDLIPVWQQISASFGRLFRSRIKRRDSFGLPPYTDRDDWATDEEREAFTRFLMEKYSRATETELRLDCPITKEIMRYPVVAADGFSYEASAMKRWLRMAKGPPRSPITGELLSHTALVPNHTLKGIIESHKEEFRARRRLRTTRSTPRKSPRFPW